MTAESTLGTSMHSLVLPTESAQDDEPLQVKHACTLTDQRILDTSRPRSLKHPGIHSKPVWTAILDDKAKKKPAVGQFSPPKPDHIDGRTRMVSYCGSDVPPSEAEVVLEPTFLEHNTASGPDFLPPSPLKDGGERLVAELTKLVRTSWDTEQSAPLLMSDMWSGAHTLPKYRYRDPESSSIPFHLQKDTLTSQTATSQLFYAPRKDNSPHSYPIYYSSNAVEKSKFRVISSSAAQSELLDNNVPRFYHSTQQQSVNNQLMKQHNEICDGIEEPVLLTPNRSLKTSFGLSPSRSPVVSKTNDLRVASQLPKNCSSKKLVEFPRTGIPSTALVRTIVRIHGSRAPSSCSDKPITKEFPPELPVRRRSHGARRVTQSVRHYAPVFKPDNVLFDRNLDIRSSLPGPRTFNLEGHLDCSCDYVCGDAGLWPADVWYQRNFHTVDHCTCPHEEIHRFFDKAASTWRLAETIAMLPIKETDILDDLVDSTSDEEELQIADHFSSIPKVSTPQPEPEESKLGFEPPLPNKRHLNLVRETGLSHACILLPNVQKSGFQQQESRSQQNNNAEKPTGILQSYDDDFVTLGELLPEKELFPSHTKHLPSRTFIRDMSDDSPESYHLSSVSVDSKQMHPDIKSTAGYTRNALIFTASSVVGSSALSPDNTVSDTKHTFANSVETTQAAGTPSSGSSGDLHDKDLKSAVVRKKNFPAVLTETGPEENINDGEPNISSSREMIQIQKVGERKSSTASWTFGDATGQANEKAQDLLREGNQTTELQNVISPSVSTEKFPEVVENDINEAESDLDLNEWLAESSDSIVSEQVKKDNEVVNHEDLILKHRSVSFHPQKVDTGSSVSTGLRNSSPRSAHFKNTEQDAVAQASHFKSNENKLKNDMRTVREQFDARQRALKRWALLSIHVGEMSDRRRKERDTTAALG
ncbi:uncharacterized protein DEA37_0004481 [Paragonimus westermani]|uniref:Uncharacterized protein n=1 Tax=Paragonimus westermani TaxID=34504 RepID=A0A5J4NY04_9TREM|nr:uncharacterized protein DEA37_0004481 [Paragonimus westermani]